MATQDATPSVQDMFLTQVQKAGVPVTVFLANGVKLQGNIVAFDRFALALARGGFTQLVYKHAVSTVMPGAVQLTATPDASIRQEIQRDLPPFSTRLSLGRRVP
jgi:host factor-I protein